MPELPPAPPVRPTVRGRSIPTFGRTSVVAATVGILALIVGYQLGLGEPRATPSASLFPAATMPPSTAPTSAALDPLALQRAMPTVVPAGGAAVCALRDPLANSGPLACRELPLVAEPSATLLRWGQALVHTEWLQFQPTAMPVSHLAVAISANTSAVALLLVKLDASLSAVETRGVPATEAGPGGLAVFDLGVLGPGRYLLAIEAIRPAGSRDNIHQDYVATLTVAGQIIH